MKKDERVAIFYRIRTTERMCLCSVGPYAMLGSTTFFAFVSPVGSLPVHPGHSFSLKQRVPR